MKILILALDLNHIKQDTQRDSTLILVRGREAICR